MTASVVTWTLVVVLNLGWRSGQTITVPNFQSLASCQSYGLDLEADVLLYDRISKGENISVNYKKCVPSDYPISPTLSNPSDVSSTVRAEDS